MNTTPDDSPATPITADDITSEMVGQLCQTAEAFRKNAYVPFSKFPVGAAVLTSDGSIYGGTNVENSSFGLTICAERVAACSAVADGSVHPQTSPIVAVAIIAEGDVSPCGACRQFLYELGPEAIVFLAAPRSDEVQQMSLADLLPMSFQIEESDDS